MAVYTEVSDEDLSRFIAGYDVGALLSVKGIAEGVENTNYLIHTEKGSFVLTLYEKRVNPADLPFFLGLMEHLAGRGVTCPLPVRDRTGRVLGSLSQRPAAMVTFLEGVSVRKPSVAHCAALGVALARLHQAGEGFAIRRENGLGPRSWRPLYERFAARADEIVGGLSGLISDELAFLDAAWPGALPQGVIHADLFPDNVFFLGERLAGLIDFYFACNDAFAYDVAVCLNAWCFEPDFSFNATKGHALLRGYQGVRPLSGAERTSLPVLCRGSALRFLLTRGYDWLHTPRDALVKPHDPLDYVRRLKFHRSVADAAAYGLESAP
ncbi:MAG: homoserine kinase [Hyphomicrobiaceae bacterium]|nr:homoserine kinase [Hyphomicrobiaceae bacterium]